nr:hypothetical protein [Neorhizobium tomejilense]
MERISMFGFLWGVRVTEFSGIVRSCIAASRGERRAFDEDLLERTLFSLMEGAHSYWRKRIETEMKTSGAFIHRGVTVLAAGEVISEGIAGTLLRGRLGHEIDGDVLRVRFVSSAAVNSIAWRPGLARDAVISVLYEMKEKFDKLGKSRPDPGTESLRRKAKLRTDDVIVRLAAVLARTDLIDGRARLAAFCSARGLTQPDEGFMAVSSGLLIRKSFIQKSFEHIQRYNERTLQSHRSGELFEDLIKLAAHDGKLNARQLFALYEIGLHLDYTLPRITAMISAVQTGGDPRSAAEASDRREAEEAIRRDQARTQRAANGQGPTEGAEHAARPRDGYEPFEDFDVPPPPVIPYSLIPMMEVLGIDVLTDERALRMAWTTRVRACHPDTLPPGSSAEVVDGATQAAAECNMAYSLLLEFLRSER